MARNPATLDCNACDTTYTISVGDGTCEECGRDLNLVTSERACGHCGTTTTHVRNSAITGVERGVLKRRRWWVCRACGAHGSRGGGR